MADTAANSRSKQQQKPREFNPRWKGYVIMLICSLVNFASITNLDVEDQLQFHGSYQFSLVFGTVTFILTFLILVFDRFQYCCVRGDDDPSESKFNYTKSMDGKIEGYTLLAFNIFWIVGVAHITQVDGVAYVAMNIYFSAWFTLFACIYTLDQWSAAKDILSIEELTGLSATLKSWYLLFLASLVAMGTSCNMHGHLADQHKSSSTYGIVLGLISTLIALFFIMLHYKFFEYKHLHLGGWMELSASFFMILLWVVGVSILTSEGGIAATIAGSGCTKLSYETGDGCFVIWVPADEEEEEGGEETTPPTQVPQPTRAPDASAGQSDPPTPMPSKGTLSPTSNEAPTSPPSAEDTQTNATEGFPPSNAINATDNTTESNVDGMDEDNMDEEGEIGVFEEDTADSSNISTSNATRWLQEMADEDIPFTLNITANGTTNPTEWSPSTPNPTMERTIPAFPTVAPTHIPYTQIAECNELLDEQIPGSNLYLACWVCFFASLNITLQWKKAQALQFAHAAQNRKTDANAGLSEEDQNASEKENDDGDNLEDQDDGDGL